MSVILVFFITQTAFSQFVSVKDGDWMLPSTWSTDPNSTAIPDSNSNVIVNHYVVASSTPYQTVECNNLTISDSGVIDNRTSAWVSGDLNVKNDLINYGVINPAYDFWLYVGGNFFNYGKVTSHYISTKQQLYLVGNLFNAGALKFTHTTIAKYLWKNSPTAHEHIIRSYNDSTMFIGEVGLQDSMGIVIIDSLAIINGKINLNGSKLVLPQKSEYSSVLILDNAQLLAGTIEANWNLIKSKNGTWGYLGENYNQVRDLKIINANMDGNFVIGSEGPYSSGYGRVYFSGETTLNGNYADWYSSSIWSAGDRILMIEGLLKNYGKFYNSNLPSGYGLYIKQIDGSRFENYGKITAKGMHFEGKCEFLPNDTLMIGEFNAVDSNTVVAIIDSDLLFGLNQSEVNFDFHHGKLNLTPDSKLTNLHGWVALRNINLEGNNSTVGCILREKGETKISNVNADWLLIQGYNDYTHHVFGDIRITAAGVFAPYYGHYPFVQINGDLTNYGRVKNNSSGTMILLINGDVNHLGLEWSNSETILNGQIDQNINLAESSLITGKVTFDAMIEGTNYQWQKNGNDIPNAVSKQLSFNNGIDTSKYGIYSCLVDGIQSRKIIVSDSNSNLFEIYDVAVTNLSSTSTKVEWKTTVPASGFIFYAENDATNGYPLEAAEPYTLRTEHSLILENLNYNSTYYFIIDQMDQDNRYIRSDEYNFVAGNLSSTGDTPFDSALATLKKLTVTPDVEGSAYIDGAFISNKLAYVVTNHNRLFRTTDGGESWIDVSPEKGTDFNKVGNTPSVHFYNENIGAVAFSNDDGANNYNYDLVFGYVWCTIDGGQTWSERFDVNDDQILHLEQATENVVYVSGTARLGVSSNRWFKKITRDVTNGTYTISDITTTPSNRPHVVSGDWLDENNGIVLARLNVNPYTVEAFRTKDGGTSWSGIQGNLPVINLAQISLSDRGIQMIDEDTFIFSYYSGNETKIYVSEDGGINWFTSEIVDSNVMLNSLSIDKSADYGLICGFNSDSSKIFYVMYADETEWTPFLLPNVKSGTDLYATELTEDGTIWVIGNKNSIWKSKPISTSIGNKKIAESPSEYQLLQNYPNPFNPTTVIKYSIPYVEAQNFVPVQLKVYDILGREVATLINEQKPAGKYEVKFDASGLSSGIYFYRIAIHSDRIQSGSFIQAKKMILTK